MTEAARVEAGGQPGYPYFEDNFSPSEYQYETFLERAARETDRDFAEDLRLGAAIAEHVGRIGGLALAVGGYARDSALSRINRQPLGPKDIDIEVYGVPVERLVEELGLFGNVDLVGASFGIFKVINPLSGRALDFSIPRRDSKVDKGHKGFQVTGDPSMSVREAARRRDLTINALALNPLSGELIDEYGGLADLKAGILRATDPQLFGDDPLRALRVMQFAGRFNFRVDPLTADICRGLELQELPGERLQEEWVKLLLKSERPSVGLRVARELLILDQLHPELAVLDQIEQEADWHPEGNVWEHTKLAVDAAARIVREENLTGEDALVVLFGALCHDMGKATTTAIREKNGTARITAYGHEAAGVEPARRFMEQLKLKHSVVEKVLPIIREHLYHNHLPEPNNKQLQRFAQRLQPANIRLWDLVCRADANGRGEVFQSRTPSYAIFERSLELNVSERPAAPIVQGRDLISCLNMEPGPHFREILDTFYDAQLSGLFTTVEEGIAYWRRTHLKEV